jgi:hypothetical protein
MRPTHRHVTMVLILLAAPAGAQQTPQRGCEAAVHRQFDFWVGEWEVRGAQDRVLGHNRISAILDGCVVLEEWTGAAGGTGKSLNSYDASTGKWKQVWVDNGGSWLELSGGLEGKRMVLMGETSRSDGSKVRHRLSYDPTTDGLRQLWEQSTDGGATWSVAFDGMYRKTG